MDVETLIIGSGVAATAIAQRLLEANSSASILVLEAGRRVKTKDYALWEQYLIAGRLPYERCWDLPYPQRDAPGENASIGATNIPLAGARVFAYGGSTLHWGGWAPRLKPEDFRLRSNTGNGADWPIPYADLEPFYGRAEGYLAVSGDSADTTVPRSSPYPFQAFPYTLEDKPLCAAMDALGIRHEKMPIARRGISATPSRHAPCQTTGTCKYCPFGARFVACDYLDDLRAWNDVPNLEVRPGVAVDRLLCSDKHTIAGAEYRDGASGETVKVNATRVIVAAGTIESAKLLQRSTSPDWPNGIGNDADLVGRHFVTHPYFIYTGSRPANSLKLQPEMNFPTLFSRHFDSEAEQARGKFILVNPPDSTPFDLAKLMQAGYDRDQIDTLLVDAHPVQLHGMVEVFGEHNNRVGSLARRNRIGLHETEVNYSAAPGFTARMAEIKAQVQRIFAAMGATLVGDASVSWRADHAGSTCRMSTDPADGVVDPTLRVHGVDNLYVCSNAVFPAIGAVNPTLTLTALALRLADRLSGAI